MIYCPTDYINICRDPLFSLWARTLKKILPSTLRRLADVWGFLLLWYQNSSSSVPSFEYNLFHKCHSIIITRSLEHQEHSYIPYTGNHPDLGLITLLSNCVLHFFPFPEGSHPFGVLAAQWVGCNFGSECVISRLSSKSCFKVLKVLPSLWWREISLDLKGYLKKQVLAWDFLRRSARLKVFSQLLMFSCSKLILPAF